MRVDGRRADELRKLKITRNYIKAAEGSVLIEMGDTKVICTATVEDSVPPFLRGKGTGWVTAEYAMLPRSSSQRIARERNKVGGARTRSSVLSAGHFVPSSICTHSANALCSSTAT